MGVLWVTQGKKFLQAENSDSGQTIRMHRLILIFAVCTCQLVPYAGYQLKRRSLITVFTFTPHHNILEIDTSTLYNLMRCRKRKIGVANILINKSLAQIFSPRPGLTEY